MAYTTQAAMKQVYGTGRINTLFSKDTGSSLDTGTFDAILARSESTINSRLGQMYNDSTPFVTGNVPVIVQTLTEIQMFKIAGPSRRNRTAGINELIEEYDKLWKQFDEGKATIEGFTSIFHLKPFYTTEGAVRSLRRSIFDAQGNRVNENEFDDKGSGGELDVW